MAMDSNVWGRDGLFERALASKLNRQDADAAATTQNAATNLLSVNNQYDLGLRRNEVDLGQLDVNRGQLDVNRGLLDVNRSKADTDRFGAETQRADAMSFWSKLPDANAISSGGLRSFTAPRLGMNSYGDKPFGMMNGGVALKPKMVKQPGYKNGGKVKMPKGYENGGQIGDVEEDKGRDTIDVKARPGEYFLNPETVARAFGDDDYEQGVRNLDEIVRDATGKEPGPVPVGKSGKPGYAWSGVLDDFGNRLPGREVPMMSDYGDLQPKSNTANVLEARAARAAQPMPSPGTIYATTQAGQAMADPNIRTYIDNATPKGPAPKPNYFDKFNPKYEWSDVKKGAEKVVDVAKKVLPSGETIAKWTPRVGKAVPVVGAAADAADALDVATDPNMRLRDTLGEIGGKGAKWAGATIGASKGAGLGGTLGAMGGPFAPITVPVGATVGGIGGGLLGYFGVDKIIEGGRALRGVDTRDPSEYSKGVLRAEEPAPAAPAAKPAEKPKARDYDAEVAAKLAESEAAKASLRNMFLDRIRANDANENFVGNRVRTAENLALMKELGDMERTAMAAGGKAKDPQKDLDERLNKRYQRPVYDKDGNIKSFIEDPEMVTQIKNAASERGLNLFNGPNAAQDNELRDLDRLYGAVRNFNSRVINQRGDSAERSDDLRNFQVRKGIGLRDTLLADKNAISIGDWWDAKWAGDNDIRNMMVVDPKTKQTAAAQHVFRNPDGSLNYDAFRLYLQANEKAKKK